MEMFTASRESIKLLIEGSRRAIPFNIVLATLLALVLIHNKAPLILIITWLFSIIVISLSRSLFCMRLAQKKLDSPNLKVTLVKFVILTFLMGIAWGACYLISLPYVNTLHEFIIILVFGGMCAGAIASLSVYMPAYLAYILPMFIPIIIYNFSFFEIDRAILATMFSLFIFMIIVSATINKNLLNENFQLSADKEVLINKLKVLSRTDALTGLYNRRYFEVFFPKVINKTKRNKQSLTIVSIDIDNFKLVNDNLGHPRGDRLLIGFSLLLNKSFKRAVDTILRMGGDEFYVVIENQPLEEIKTICEDVKNQFKSEVLNQEEYLENTIFQEQKISLSIGILNISSENDFKTEYAVEEVDKALYKAKSNGKDKIVMVEFDDSV